MNKHEWIRLEEIESIVENLWPTRLGRNLATVGALFAAFRAGDNFGFHMGSDESQCTCQWSPGRGIQYTGLTRCESEGDDYDYEGKSAFGDGWYICQKCQSDDCRHAMGGAS